jgi:predicted ATPase
MSIVLCGRDRDRAILDDLTAQARSGTSQVLVLRGEAGVGKTALLDYVAEQATGFSAMRVTGVQEDMELAFAGL